MRESIEDKVKASSHLYRVQRSKSREETGEKTERDEGSRLLRNHSTGDTYLIDGNVAGSDEWTWDKPKFSLEFFRDHISKVLDLR
jgi:hypothetical protein